MLTRTNKDQVLASGRLVKATIETITKTHNERIDFAIAGFTVYARYDSYMKIVNYPFSCIDRVAIGSCRMLLPIL